MMLKQRTKKIINIVIITIINIINIISKKYNIHEDNKNVVDDDDKHWHHVN